MQLEIFSGTCLIFFVFFNTVSLIYMVEIDISTDQFNIKQDFNLKPFQIKFLACLLLVLITGHSGGFGGHREGFGGLGEY